MISTSKWIIYFAIYLLILWKSMNSQNWFLFTFTKENFPFKIIFSRNEHKMCSSFFVNLCHQILDCLYFSVPNLLVFQCHPYIWVYSYLAFFPNSHCSSLVRTTASSSNLIFILFSIVNRHFPQTSKLLRFIVLFGTYHFSLCTWNQFLNIYFSSV